MTTEERKLQRLHNRLAKIGIDVTFAINYPWVYLNTINGKRVTETYRADHGFTIIYMPIRNDRSVKHFIDIGEMFKLIRKYI